LFSLIALKSDAEREMGEGRGREEEKVRYCNLSNVY